MNDVLDARSKFIENVINEQTKEYVLSEEPTAKELLPFLRLNIKKKRLLKKFLKKPLFYCKRLPKKIVKEFTIKNLSLAIKGAVWDVLNRESFARQVFLVEPLEMDIV